MTEVTEDPKFARVQPGAPWWYWNAAGTAMAKVARDGSGRLWSNWGDERGSTRMPDGPAVLPYNACLCTDLVRCQERGAALAIVRELAGPVLAQQMYVEQVSGSDLSLFNAMLKIYTTANRVL